MGIWSVRVEVRPESGPEAFKTTFAFSTKPGTVKDAEQIFREIKALIEARGLLWNAGSSVR